jgi:hypothetical protein
MVGFISPISSRKQRAALGDLEAPLARGQRAGKGALLVAEQLAFEQLRRNGPAIDRGTNGRWRRGETSWIARAATSLPVPDSPRISTLLSNAATWPIR